MSGLEKHNPVGATLVLPKIDSPDSVQLNAGI